MKLDHTFSIVDQSVEIESTNEHETFSIPLCIDDIISICKDFNSLGWQVQNQIENILENGVEESIKSGFVKQESLPCIKYFLHKVYSNAYFGDASSQAQDCLMLIKQYEEKHKIEYTSKSN